MSYNVSTKVKGPMVSVFTILYYFRIYSYCIALHAGRVNHVLTSVEQKYYRITMTAVLKVLLLYLC